MDDPLLHGTTAANQCRVVTGLRSLSFLLLLSLTAFCRADLLIARPR